ncbi:MAG: hypothetical protein IJ779_11715 [Ruminococcus sp.]|nr:hypothetical protein [Ruminococcus sp.]
MFEDQNNNSQYSVSGVETVTGKSKGKKAAVVGGIAAVALAGGCASAYAFSDTVQNQVKLRTMKPEKYFAWVCENNGSEIAKNASANYEKAVKKLKDGTGVNYNISYEMSDSLKSQLKDSVGGDEDLLGVIDNIKTITLDLNGAVGNGGISYNINALLNGDKLAGIDYTLDPSNMGMSIRCPELTEKWLSIDTASLTEEITYDEDAQKILDFYKDFLSDPESILTAQQLEDEINKYIGVWNNTTKDVKIEKKETVTIGDIEMDYTVAEIPVTADMAKEMGTNFLNELKNDEVAKGIIVDRLGVPAEDFTNDLEDALSDISGSEGGSETVTFRSYIDPTGQIRGVSITDGDGQEVRAILGKDGDQIRGELVAEGETLATLTATEGSGKSYTGKLEITSDDETASFDFDSLKVVNEEDGYAEGNVTVNIPDSDPMTIVLSSDGKSQNIAFDLNIEGEDYGKLILDYSVNNGEKVSIPDESNKLVLSKDNMNTFQPEDYVTEDEVAAFLKDIFTKVGIKDADEASKALAGEVFGSGYSYDDEDYDYDWDDEEFDWDDEDFEWDDEEFDFSDIEKEDDAQDDNRSSAGSEVTIDPDQFKIDIPEVEMPTVPQISIS